MNLAVIGSRSFTDRALAFRILDRFHAAHPVACLVSGGARGADSIAHLWAMRRGVSTRIHLPDWRRHGHRAALLRNHAIIAAADTVIAFWNGASRGTAYSLRLARQRRIPTHIVRF